MRQVYPFTNHLYSQNMKPPPTHNTTSHKTHPQNFFQSNHHPPFSTTAKLAAGSQVSTVLLVDFRDSTTPATFDVRCNNHNHQLCISPPIGEIVRPNTIGEKEFLTLQGLTSVFIVSILLFWN